MKRVNKIKLKTSGKIRVELIKSLFKDLVLIWELISFNFQIPWKGAAKLKGLSWIILQLVRGLRASVRSQALKRWYWGEDWRFTSRFSSPREKAWRKKVECKQERQTLLTHTADLNTLCISAGRSAAGRDSVPSSGSAWRTWTMSCQALSNLQHSTSSPATAAPAALVFPETSRGKVTGNSKICLTPRQRGRNERQSVGL